METKTPAGTIVLDEAENQSFLGFKFGAHINLEKGALAGIGHLVGHGPDRIRGRMFGQACHEMAAIKVRIWSSSASYQPTIGGQIMKRLTSAQLFAPPKMVRKTKARLERAKLVVVAARERAAETAQQYAAQPSTMRPPTVLQRRRLAGRFSGKF